LDDVFFHFQNRQLLEWRLGNFASQSLANHGTTGVFDCVG